MGEARRSEWRRWLRELRAEVLSDHTQTAAAALAFHGLFGALPALAVAAAVFGLLVGVEPLGQPVAEDTGPVLPEEARGLLLEFVTEVPTGFGFGLALLANVALALWAAQRAASGLLTALNIVYDEVERRSWWRRELAAIGIALGGLALLLVVLGLVALPPLAATLGLAADGGAVALLERARWPLLVVVIALALGLLYSHAPSRERPRREWLGPGTLTATVGWLLGSWLLSLYVGVAGGFGAFYGSLGAAVVVLLWFYVASMALLVGAEINALRLERARGTLDETKLALRAREGSDRDRSGAGDRPGAGRADDRGRRGSRRREGST